MLATHRQFIRCCISLDFCSLFLIAKFKQEIIKRKKLAWNFCEGTLFRKAIFWYKELKTIWSVMDRPMFLNTSKTFCHLGRLGTWNLIDVFSKVFPLVMHASWQIDMCKDWKNHLSSAPSACDFQKVYLRSILCCNKCQWNFLFSTIRHNAYLIEFTKGRYLLQQE